MAGVGSRTHDLNVVEAVMTNEIYDIEKDIEENY